jgi:glycerol-3-phosphate acyltransferase PlsY
MISDAHMNAFHDLPPWGWLAGAIAVGFLCGSVPFGVLFARLRGVDLQKVGSGNIGATNAARALGKKIGVLVLLCDAGKAIAPILIARYVLHPPSPRWVEVAIGLGAVAGHMFPPWLRFHGGKGVATAFGVFLTIAPIPAAIAAAVWVTLYTVTRTSSVGSLTAVGVVPLAAWLLGGDTPVVALAICLAPLIVYRHKDNIRRLLRREESKV